MSARDIPVLLYDSLADRASSAGTHRTYVDTRFQYISGAMYHYSTEIVSGENHPVTSKEVKWTMVTLDPMAHRLHLPDLDNVLHRIRCNTAAVALADVAEGCTPQTQNIINGLLSLQYSLYANTHYMAAPVTFQSACICSRTWPASAKSSRAVGHFTIITGPSPPCEMMLEYEHGTPERCGRSAQLMALYVTEDSSFYCEPHYRQRLEHQCCPHCSIGPKYYGQSQFAVCRFGHLVHLTCNAGICGHSPCSNGPPEVSHPPLPLVVPPRSKSRVLRFDTTVRDTDDYATYHYRFLGESPGQLPPVCDLYYDSYAYDGPLSTSISDRYFSDRYGIYYNKRRLREMFDRRMKQGCNAYSYSVRILPGPFIDHHPIFQVSLQETIHNRPAVSVTTPISVVTVPYLHDMLEFSLFVDQLPHLTDIYPLWKSASASGFSQINVDTWAWYEDPPKNPKNACILDFVSESSVPLTHICKSLVLRILTPDTNDLTGNHLDVECSNLRSRTLQEHSDFFPRQLEQCTLFSLASKRPPVMLPYAPGKLIQYAEKLISFLPSGRTNSGLEIVEMVRSSAEFLIQIPLGGSKINCPENSENDCEDTDPALAALRWWHRLKIALDFASNVGVALDIPADIPTELGYVIDLWRSEPIKTIILSTGIFTTDLGTPSLSAAHKIVIQSFLRLKHVTVTLRPGGILTADDVSPLSPYMEYLRGLHHEAMIGLSEEIPDPVLFPPDHPLHENLSESHYENFELDGKKYDDYEQAIRDYIKLRQSEGDVPEIFRIAVVGCGRGPLVSAAISAIRDLNVEAVIYAVEKNPGVVEHLKEMLQTDWAGWDVRLIMEDMRTWKPDFSLDILLSEMLGGFGDNELSPECLAGPERFLSVKGVSIPASYTSFLCPISSTKIYELFPALENGKVREHVYGFDVDCFTILDEPQPVFTFSHPSSLPDKCQRNVYQKLTFKAKLPGVLHGFAGGFTASLFGDIEHCFLPGRCTPGLRTWSKIFFPLIIPCLLAKDDVISLHFWRRSDERSVWYEWTLRQPVVTPLHNHDGHACRMPLFFATPDA